MSAAGKDGADVPLRSIESLSVSIDGATPVKKLSLAVRSGEILGLAGASGSGKSMTALAIMQLLPPCARLDGSVRRLRLRPYSSLRC